MARLIEVALAFLQARRRARWSRTQLEAYQPAPPQCPVETAAEFEEYFAARNILKLSLAEARHHAERELAGEPPAFSGYSLGLSTGSTGRPGVFLTSTRERHAWAGTILAKFLPWRLLVGAEIALILKHNNRLYANAGKRLHFFNAAAPVASWIGRLCALQPDVLIGPPSVLEQVARLASTPLKPRLLLAGAEPLFPQDRAFLMQAYGVAPRVIYQAKEGFLAAECAHGGIHLNEDLIHFERVPLGRGRFVPVITDFTRTSQTYRRFRLDDVLIESAKPCACRQPFARVAAVEGRTQDVLSLNNERLFPLEVNALLWPHLQGRDYRVTQLTADRVALAVDGGAPVDAIDALSLHVQVTVEKYAPRAPGEKRRRIQRLFPDCEL